MSEPGNCCAAQTLQVHTNQPLSVEPSMPEKSTLKEVMDDHDHHSTIESKLRDVRGCPKMKTCPGKPAIQWEYVTENGDGDKITLDRVKNVSPGSSGLDPVPVGVNIPLEYWTPLAGLTRTRPAVENFSLSRFSPSEWREHNERVSAECRKGIQVSALAGYNAHRSISRAYAEADRNQVDSNIRLNMRAGIIYRWKTEFKRTVSEIVGEIDLVQEARRRTMRAKSVLQLVESIGKDMMHARCFRVDTDLVHDQVTEELRKELSLCQEMKDVYIRLLDQMKVQIEELRTAKQRLEFDWSEKTEAYAVDSHSRGLSSKSNTILWKSGSVRIPPEQSSTSGYEYSARKIITEGQTAKHRASTLRVNLDAMIGTAIRDLRDQADRTDLALTEQIQLHEQTIRRLEVELDKDLHQLSDTEALICEIHNASKKLDGAMKCAQTRLDNRLLRHGAENCRDNPQFGLIEEVKSLSEDVTATLGLMKRADDSTNSLLQTRRNIERELIIQRQSLYVDRQRCQLLRTFYPSAQALAGN